MDSNLVFADEAPDSTLHARVQSGQLIRLARGIYASSAAGEPEQIVRQTWRQIVGHRFSGAVVTDRSAVWAQPHDGYLFIASKRDGVLELPGMTVVSRKDSGPAAGDMDLGGGVHLASRGRALLDNTRHTRQRGRRPRATLTAHEFEDWVDHLCAVDGEDRVDGYRREADQLARDWGVVEGRVTFLNDVVGAVLGTRPARSGSRAMHARASGQPYDGSRLIRFELLAEYLRNVMTSYPALPQDATRRTVLPFWEAYFSNFIEGTEFEPDEAERIVFEGEVPESRPLDAHDVLSTYSLVSDEGLMSSPVSSADEFLDRLQQWHEMILSARPDKRPGQFKISPNQAGNTTFVAPTLVEGTLRRGFELLRGLATPSQRGTFAAFLVAEVHPFDDGNGRLARAIMNAEYVAGAEQRAVIPTVSRNDYLRALRRLTRQDQPDLFVTFLDRARRWTSRIDWSTLPASRHDLDHTNAFVDAVDAEERGIHLLDPVDASLAITSL